MALRVNYGLFPSELCRRTSITNRVRFKPRCRRVPQSSPYIPLVGATMDVRMSEAPVVAADMAQAGGNDMANVKKAISLVENFLKEL